MHNGLSEIEEHLERLGDMECAPDHLVDQAKLYARTLVFHLPPSRRVSPAEAKMRAEQWLRNRIT